MAIWLGSCFLRHGSHRGSLHFNSHSVGFLSGTECQTSALLLSFPSSFLCLWHSLLQTRSPFFSLFRIVTAALSCLGALWPGIYQYFRKHGELLWPALFIFATTAFLSTMILWVPGMILKVPQAPSADEGTSQFHNSCNTYICTHVPVAAFSLWFTSLFPNILYCPAPILPSFPTQLIKIEPGTISCVYGFSFLLVQHRI